MIKINSNQNLYTNLDINLNKIPAIINHTSNHHNQGNDHLSHHDRAYKINIYLKAKMKS